MINLKDYFSDSYEFMLSSANYQAKFGPIDPANQKLIVLDNIEVFHQENNIIKVDFTRTVNFQPEQIFELSVTFSIFLSAKNQSDNLKQLKDSDIIETLSVGTSPITTNIMSRMSLLIAQITSSFGQMPLSTAPLFIHPQTEKNPSSN